jgi:hypothetical protein
MTRYRMKKDATTEPKATAGTIVYACAKHDYGLARDDTRMTGTPHISVTMRPDGDYPFFTVPKDSLEEVAE